MVGEGIGLRMLGWGEMEWISDCYIPPHRVSICIGISTGCHSCAVGIGYYSS